LGAAFHKNAKFTDAILENGEPRPLSEIFPGKNISMTIRCFALGWIHGVVEK
jgi:hypothetical protein